MSIPWRTSDQRSETRRWSRTGTSDNSIVYDSTQANGTIYPFELLGKERKYSEISSSTILSVCQFSDGQVMIDQGPEGDEEQRHLFLAILWLVNVILSMHVYQFDTFETKGKFWEFFFPNTILYSTVRLTDKWWSFMDQKVIKNRGIWHQEAVATASHNSFSSDIARVGNFIFQGGFLFSAASVWYPVLKQITL